MAIIAFWSNEEKETGQTMSMIALTTYMAIEHNYRILSIGTSFKDKTLENSYWNMTKMENLIKNISQTQDNQVNIESGVEGLIKVINSNIGNRSVVQNYTRIVFRDRLDVLCSPRTENYEDYKATASMYTKVLQTANRSYDLVFIDVSKSVPKDQIKQILEMADIIVINFTQKLQHIDNYIKLREENDFFKKKNILLNIGRYDKYSKYNIKNVSRYMKEKKDVNATLYNTLFFEACSEANVAELFLRLRKVEDDDRNGIFIAEIKKMADNLIYKMQELQIKI